MKKSFFNFLLVYVISALAFINASAQEYVSSIEEAKQIAKSDKKHILAIFSGSDWCKPCILLKQNILSSDDFKNFAKDDFVILALDFPYKKANRLSKEQQNHNDALAAKYNRKGQFPLVLVMDEQENILGQINYQPKDTPIEFINLIANVTLLN